jgi:hypothetical protein
LSFKVKTPQVVRVTYIYVLVNSLLQECRASTGNPQAQVDNCRSSISVYRCRALTNQFASCRPGSSETYGLDANMQHIIYYRGLTCMHGSIRNGYIRELANACTQTHRCRNAHPKLSVWTRVCTVSVQANSEDRIS